METFALAAISLIIAVSIWIRKKKGPVHVAFSIVCFSLFVQKSGAFFSGYFPGGIWKAVHYTGMLSIAPGLVFFSRHLTGSAELIPRRAFLLVSIGSILVMASFLSGFAADFILLERVPEIWTGLVVLYCGAMLLLYVKRESNETDRKRMVYILIACGVTAVVGTTEFLGRFGIPSFYDMVIAGLLYFILIVITHTELPELYELMARGLLELILILFTTLVFLITVGIFRKGMLPPVNTILVAALIIVVSLEPIKMILKKIFDHFFPESPELSASIYGFDKELEKEKSALLDEMATGLAHEIRNPLGAIKGAAQYLREDGIAGDGARFLNVIIEEVDRLNAVVSQFLNYAKPYTPNVRPHDINQIIQKAVAIIRASRPSDRIMIETDLPPGLPQANVDPEQMIQVILNIAFNAIDAMPEGGVLSLRTFRIGSDTGDAIGLMIRDTGKGMRNEDLKNIFKPFFTTKERGVGLGLSICQRIVRQHGGVIRVKSIPDQGTIFFIRLGISP
ncbi:MAG: ATP-binding protein [Syntrophales bacterium]|nr:ATP-binding protein [Syntrophales bacterium]